MPGFRKDFQTITERVANLQPWLDKAHTQIMAPHRSISTGYPRVTDYPAKQVTYLLLCDLIWKWCDLGGLLT